MTKSNLRLIVAAAQPKPRKKVKIGSRHTPGLLIRTPLLYCETLPEMDEDARKLQAVLLGVRESMNQRVASLNRRWTT